MNKTNQSKKKGGGSLHPVDGRLAGLNRRVIETRETLIGALRCASPEMEMLAWRAYRAAETAYYRAAIESPIDKLTP